MVTGKLGEVQLPHLDSDPDAKSAGDTSDATRSTTSVGSRLGRIGGKVGSKFRSLPKRLTSQSGEGEQNNPSSEDVGDDEPAPEEAVPVHAAKPSRIGKFLRGLRDSSSVEGDNTSTGSGSAQAAAGDEQSELLPSNKSSSSKIGKFLRNFRDSSTANEVVINDTNLGDETEEGRLQAEGEQSPPPIPPKPSSNGSKSKLLLHVPVADDNGKMNLDESTTGKPVPPIPPRMPEELIRHAEKSMLNKKQVSSTSVNDQHDTNGAIVDLNKTAVEFEKLVLEEEDPSTKPLVTVDSRGRIVSSKPKKSTKHRSNDAPLKAITSKTSVVPAAQEVENDTVSESLSTPAPSAPPRSDIDAYVQTDSSHQQGSKSRKSKKKGNGYSTVQEVDDSPPLMVWDQKNITTNNSTVRNSSKIDHQGTEYQTRRLSRPRSYQSDDSERRRRHKSKKKSLRRATSSQRSTAQFGSSRSLAAYSTATLKRGSRLKLLGKPEASTWDVPRVAAWLDMIGLSQYTKAFEENGVNGQVLLLLDRDQIVRGFGITDHYHLQSLERGIQELRKRNIIYSSWDWTAEGVQIWLLKRGFDLLCERFYSAAIHGGVLFNLTRDEISTLVCEAHNPNGTTCPEGEHTHHHELIVESLLLSIERAKTHGRDSDNGIPDWGGQDIQVWLTENHLGHLHEKFASHCMSGMLLLQLTREDMEEVMELTEIQAMVLEKAIIKLKQQNLKSQGVVGRIASVMVRGANKKPVRKQEHYVERNETSDYYYDDEYDSEYE